MPKSPSPDGGRSGSTPEVLRVEPDRTHWLVRPETIRKLWIALYGILALTLLPDLFVKQYSHFGFDDTKGFYAAYGFLACVAMVLLAKVLGAVLKREDTYYDR